MGSNIRNGVLFALGIAVVAYVASFASHHGNSSSNGGNPASAGAPAVVAASSGTPPVLTQSGSKFVLEVRGLGVVTGRDTNDEIWRAIEAKADNHVSYLSQNPADYPSDADTRASNLGLVEGVAFEQAAMHAVERWPVPVIIWGPPKDPKNSFRPAADISDLRQKAGLGATLLLWQDDANTNDGARMVQRLFDFFDANPDAPAALVFSMDGTTTRALLKAPGSGFLSQGQFIPALPDSMAAILVSRSDRVDALIRPFAVPDTEKQYTDDDKLWDYFWRKNDGDGPDDFVAFYKNHIAEKDFDLLMMPHTMSSDWWQKQLPAFWKEIGNQGPGVFKPSPYIPVRWTASQLKQFDSAPILGYVHRPVEIKLADEHGQPLKAPAEVDALREGWQRALETLPNGEEPKRVFYDTSESRQWVIPLNQALSEADKSPPNLSDVKEGYDIGNRIGNTGVSSPLVQIGLGLIASFENGGVSATINRSPNGTASIIMVSPPDAATRAAVVASHGKDPFTSGG